MKTPTRALETALHLLEHVFLNIYTVENVDIHFQHNYWTVEQGNQI